MLLEQEILRHDGADAAAPAQLRGDHGQVQKREQDLLHARVSVGQKSGPRNVAPSYDWRDNQQFETHRSPVGTAGGVKWALSVTPATELYLTAALHARGS